MITPQQFLESFFHEKIAIYRDVNVRLAPVLAKYFGPPLSERTHDFLLLDGMREVIDDVMESAGSALVTTSIKSQRVPGAALRKRYHLAAMGEDWKITRIDRECFVCCGAGRSGTMPCQHCGGEGWTDSGKNAS